MIVGAIFPALICMSIIIITFSGRAITIVTIVIVMISMIIVVIVVVIIIVSIRGPKDNPHGHNDGYHSHHVEDDGGNATAKGDTVKGLGCALLLWVVTQSIALENGEKLARLHNCNPQK